MVKRGTRKRFRPMTRAQRFVFNKLGKANGKVVVLSPVETRTARSIVKRGTAVETATGFKLAPSWIYRPSWYVEASFAGTQWDVRDQLCKAVPGYLGSGFFFITRRYDITWQATSKERAASIAARLRAVPTRVKVRVKIYPSRKPKAWA